MIAEPDEINSQNVCKYSSYVWQWFEQTESQIPTDLSGWYENKMLRELKTHILPPKWPKLGWDLKNWASGL